MGIIKDLFHALIFVIIIYSVAYIWQEFNWYDIPNTIMLLILGWANGDMMENNLKKGNK